MRIGIRGWWSEQLNWNRRIREWRDLCESEKRNGEIGDSPLNVSEGLAESGVESGSVITFIFLLLLLRLIHHTWDQFNFNIIIRTCLIQKLLVFCFKDRSNRISINHCYRQINILQFPFSFFAIFSFSRAFNSSLFFLLIY